MDIDSERLDRYACWMSAPDLAWLRMAMKVGFTQVVLDIEHNPFGVDARAAFVVAAQAMGARVYLKIEGPTVVAVQRAVDLAPDAIIIPHIGPLAESTSVLSAVKYPPLGQRSFAGGRSSDYGVPDDAGLDAANGRTLCLPMIETPEAAADAGAIAAHPCVDGLFVGPFDLSLTSGRGSYTFGDGDREAIAGIALAASAAGKPWWMPAWSAPEQRFAREQGVGLTIVALDRAVALAGLRAAVDDLA